MYRDHSFSLVTNQVSGEENFMAYEIFSGAETREINEFL